MEVRYVKQIDPSSLNGYRAVFEASQAAAEAAFEDAYKIAKAYGTPLVNSHEGKTIYIDPNKYSLEDIKAQRYLDDPSIYDAPAILS